MERVLKVTKKKKFGNPWLNLSKMRSATISKDLVPFVRAVAVKVSRSTAKKPKIMQHCWHKSVSVGFLHHCQVSMSFAASSRGRPIIAVVKARTTS